MYTAKSTLKNHVLTFLGNVKMFYVIASQENTKVPYSFHRDFG